MIVLFVLFLLACNADEPSADRLFPDTARTDAETDADTDADTDSDADVDSDTDTDSDADTDSDTDTDAVAYHEGDGPWTVLERDDTVAGQEVTWFLPADAESAPVVLWSHGFARSRTFHAEAARHAASWGLVVVTVDLPSPYGGHEENGAFLAEELLPEALARPETGETWAFVGHSAGGLASVLAAAAVDADALVGLDAVDASDLGADAAPSVQAPTLMLAGVPGSCNSNGNSRLWEFGSTSWQVEVTDASHCDFENPTEGLCELACGAADAARQDLAGEYATAWLVHTLLGGADDWIEGAESEADRAAGHIAY